jgi:GMP synthase-like glutamine amidotransferase
MGMLKCPDTPTVPLMITIFQYGEDEGPGTFPVFHWHEETFNLPAGATLLVRGSSVENQAFRLGSAVGVQFHPEVDVGIIAVWARTLPADLRAAIIAESRTLLGGNTRRCEGLLDAFIREWKR